MDTLTPDIDDEKVEKIKAIFPSLTKRQQSVIELLYGLNGKAPIGYDEAGAMLNTTGGRARQIEAQVLKKLKKEAV